MAMYKVKKVRYKYGPSSISATKTNLSVPGNTEGAVKERLAKLHGGKAITIIELIWA